MAFWKKLWLLFTVIWVIVASLNIMTILVFSDEIEHSRVFVPAVFAVAVPAAAFLFGFLWEFLRKRKRLTKK